MIRVVKWAGISRCRLMAVSERDIKEVFCTNPDGLEFYEIYEKLREKYQNLRKIDVREIISKLVRAGEVERVADHERRRMVFRIKENRCRES